MPVTVCRWRWQRFYGTACEAARRPWKLEEQRIDGFGSVQRQQENAEDQGRRGIIVSKTESHFLSVLYGAMRVAHGARRSVRSATTSYPHGTYRISSSHWRECLNRRKDHNIVSETLVTSRHLKSVLDPYLEYSLDTAPESANTRWKTIWKALTRLVSNNYSPHYGSQSPTSRPILAGPFHSRPLVSHCSTGPQKMVLMPGSTWTSGTRAPLTYYIIIDASTLLMPLAMSWNNSPKLVNPLLQI